MCNPINSKKVLIFSGAGISTENGNLTLNNTNRFWDEDNINIICSVEVYRDDPQRINTFYDARRADLRDQAPNASHEMVARLKRKYPDRIEVITENIDDLFERAGCPDVIHLNGTLREMQCTDCGTHVDLGYEPQKDMVCPGCRRSKYLRHNVVMLGESAPMYKKLGDAVDDCDLLVVIGSNSKVARISFYAKRFEKSILNNLTMHEFFDNYFTTVYYDKPTVAAPIIEAEIERFLS